MPLPCHHDRAPARRCAACSPRRCRRAAVYKVVQPDGSITYTDRPPPAGSGRITTLGGDNAPAAPAAVLPQELRLAAQRYPVTLLHVTRLRTLRQRPAPAAAARRALQRAPGDHRRGRPGPGARRRRPHGACPDHRRAAAARPVRDRLDSLPGRRRLSARVPPAARLATARAHPAGRASPGAPGAGSRPAGSARTRTTAAGPRRRRRRPPGTLRF